MLKGTLAFLVLVLFAVLGSEIRLLLARRGLRAPAMEGLSFLVIGLAMRGLGLFPADVLATLRPVVLIGLAWIGLVFGLQIELRVLRHLRPWHLRLGLAVPLVVGVIVTAASAALGISVALSFGLGAVAAAASPSTLEGISRGRVPLDRSAVRLLKLVIAFSGIPAVLVLHGPALLWSPITTLGGGTLPWWHLPILSLGLGLIMGYTLAILVRGVTEPIQLLTLMTGAMAALAGASAVLGLGSLPAAAVVGAVLVNRTVFPHRVLKVAHSIERPMLLALLVLVGASWNHLSFSWQAFVVMVPIRWLAVLAAGALLTHRAEAHQVPLTTAKIGHGLLTQGELALGLLVALVGSVAGSEGVLEAVVAAMVINQLLGQWWLRRQLFAPQQDPTTSTA